MGFDGFLPVMGPRGPAASYLCLAEWLDYLSTDHADLALPLLLLTLKWHLPQEERGGELLTVLPGFERCHRRPVVDMKALFALISAASVRHFCQSMLLPLLSSPPDVTWALDL